MDTAMVFEYGTVILVIFILAVLGIFLLVYLGNWMREALDAASEARSAARIRGVIENAITLDYGRDMIANQEMTKINDFARERRLTAEAFTDKPQVEGRKPGEWPKYPPNK